MEQPLYLFISWVADLGGLLWLVEPYKEEILSFLVVLALFSCLFGFYLYRGMVAFLTLMCVVATSFLWIAPTWGAHIAVTVCAVVGVPVAFIAFRLRKLGAVALCSAISGSLLWLFLGSPETFTFALVILIFLGALLAGLVTYFFPLWSIYFFTALWGAVVFAMERGRLWGAGPQVNAMTFVLGLVLTIGGFVLQFQLFRKQKVFEKIMPKKLEYWLEKRQKREVEA